MSSAIIHLVGNLGKAPELRYTPQGKAVCDYSIAVNTKKKDRDGNMGDITTWFKITSWDKQAENDSKYLDKGKLVGIVGRLTQEEWQDQQGNKRFTLVVQPMHIEYLSGKPDENQNQYQPQSAKEEKRQIQDEMAEDGW